MIGEARNLSKRTGKFKLLPKQRGHRYNRRRSPQNNQPIKVKSGKECSKHTSI